MSSPDSSRADRAASTLRRLGAPAGRWNWWVVGPLILYVLLVVAGVTQSSIGISTLRVDPLAPTPTMIGGGVGIRSDEYLTSTPLRLGVIATGDLDDHNPLTAEQGFLTQLPSGPVSSVVLLDGTLLQLGGAVPAAMLLAATWWLPFLLLALGAPAYFRALTGRPWTGLFAAALIVLSPASAWWSFSPVGVLGFALAGTAALQRVPVHLTARRYGRAVGWALCAALLLARTPLLYQPWAIVLGLSVLLVAVVAMLGEPRARWTAGIAVGGVGVLTLLLIGGVVLENRDALTALLGTSYPGSRVASGSAGPFSEVFGATDLAGLKDLLVAGSNASELSSSFAVAAVWAVLLLLAGHRLERGTHRRAVVTMLGLTAFWFVWSTADLGGLAGHVPVLNRVTASRSGDVLGYLGILLLCLVLPAVAALSVRRAALVAGAVALPAVVAGSLLRAGPLPELSAATIWLSGLVLAAVVLVVTLRPGWWVGYAAAVCGAALLVWNVNPVLLGLGDLRGTPVAEQMLAEGATARADGALWATDSVYVDALLAATGVPSLSSRQLAGPDRAGWDRLDPTGASEAAWNRGGSHITFVWTDSDVLTVANPTLDVIAVTGSPCAVARAFPALSDVVSSGALDLGCLVEAGSFSWSGQPYHVYRVAPSGA